MFSTALSSIRDFSVSVLSASTERRSPLQVMTISKRSAALWRVIRDTGSVKLETSRHSCLMTASFPDALQILNLDHGPGASRPVA